MDATAIAASSIEERCKALPYIGDITTRIEPAHAYFILTLNKPAHITLLQSHIKAPLNASLLFTQSTGDIKDEIGIIIKGSDVAVIRAAAKDFAHKLLPTVNVQDIIYHFKK